MQRAISTSVAIATLALLLSFATVIFAKDDDEQPLVGTPSINEAAAFSIAEEAYTGAGVFTDIELEMEEEVLVYAVEYTEADGNEVDVKINAKTGAVVLVESDKDELADDDGDDVDEDEELHTPFLLRLLQQLLALVGIGNQR